MTYQVLANKWRPTDFAEIIGQSSVVTILRNSLETCRLHHAYLFTGTRGVGKTTIARILAKALVCAKGISSSPCNNCEFCNGVNKGNCLDVIEIDAASKTKVEDTRLILDNLVYAPNKARFKIYIIDEIHMLSNHSFNALLKSLEEPPEHVKFLLATTDPQKLPITVLSRCLQLKLKLFPISEIVSQLERILNVENKVFEQEGLLQIAIAANGSMRDALSLLEQILAFSYKLSIIDYHVVIQALNLPDEIKTINLLKAVILSDLNMVLCIIKDLFLDNCDPLNILQRIQLLIKNIIILQLLSNDAQNNNLNVNNSKNKYQNNSDDYNNQYNLNEILYKDLLLELAELSTEEDLQLYYEIAVQGFKNLPFTPDPKVGFEITILRMLAFRPLKLPIDQKLKASTLLPNDLTSIEKAVSFNSDLNAKVKNDKVTLAKDLEEISAIMHVSNLNNLISPKNSNIKVDFGKMAHIIDNTNNENSKSIVHPIGNKVETINAETEFDYLNLIEKLEISGLTKDLAANGIFNSISEHSIKMIIDQEKKLMVTNKNITNLQSAFSKLLGKAIKLKVEFVDFSLNPSLFTKTLKYKQQIKEQQFIAEDDNLQQLLSNFNGEVECIEGLT